MCAVKPSTTLPGDPDCVVVVLINLVEAVYRGRERIPLERNLPHSQGRALFLLQDRTLKGGSVSLSRHAKTAPTCEYTNPLFIIEKSDYILMSNQWIGGGKHNSPWA